MVFCHPFDDPAVVAGQGTLGLELVEDVRRPGVRRSSPSAAAGWRRARPSPSSRCGPTSGSIGVQAAVCAPYVGGASPTGPVVTLADGIAVKRPGTLTGPLIAEWVDELVAVDEDAIADAMVMLMDRAKLYVEGAGAVGVAAVAAGLVDAVGRPGRRASCCPAATSTSASCPGSSAATRRRPAAASSSSPASTTGRAAMVRLLGAFAAAGANLVEVEHQREGVALHVRETGVHATFEVRSRDHAQLVLEAVRDAGYPDLRAGERLGRRGSTAGEAVEAA